ncbi:MAG: TIGR02221 family CRISPR-associated protein [Candidatus Helarchaeota archaeon]
MVKIFMSFLGTSDYLPCNYVNDLQEKVENVRFIQEALVVMFCKSWTPKDKIVIFLTPQAKMRNWQDNGHLDRDKKPLQREGLERRFTALKLAASIHSVDIPLGNSEADIWQIFERILNQIEEGDEIIFDITHAFRSIPMLALVVLNYAKIVKDIRVLGIYYGAFESLGSPKDVEKRAIKDRNAPIFNLTPFWALLDWTNVLDHFLVSGDANRILERMSEDIRPILIKTGGRNREALEISKLGKQLNYLTEIIRTCRGTEIISFDYDALKKLITKNQASMIKPLNPMLEKIQKKLEVFTNDSIKNGYAAVKWCIDHDLIQQGFTILQETLFSELSLQYFPQKKITDKESRTLISQALNIKERNLAEESWKEPATSHRKDVYQIIHTLDDELVKISSQIRQYRNDLNHAGLLENALKAKKFKEQLNDCYMKIGYKKMIGLNVI